MTSPGGGEAPGAGSVKNRQDIMPILGGEAPGVEHPGIRPTAVVREESGEVTSYDVVVMLGGGEERFVPRGSRLGGELAGRPFRKVKAK